MTKTRIALGLGSLSVAASLALFPANVGAHGGDPDDMMEDLAQSMKRPVVLKVQGKTAKLSIVHVRTGCHTWSTGMRKSPGAKVYVKRGTRLRLTNMDIDTHRLVRVSGPKVWLGKPMRMNDAMTLRFARTGTYRLMTTRVEDDEAMDVKTVGEDHVLGLVVIVR